MTERAVTVGLKSWEVGCLTAAATEYGAYITSAEIGAVAWPSLSRRQASGAATACMRNLEKRGLVERADKELPIIWRATEAGRAALRQKGEG